MLSRFGITDSAAANYAIAFAIILVVVALFGLVLRRLTGGRPLLPGHDRDALPDFAALSEAGHSWRDLAAHSDMMWNRALNALVARHMAWADFEIEAKAKNLASDALATEFRDGGSGACAS